MKLWGCLPVTLWCQASSTRWRRQVVPKASPRGRLLRVRSLVQSVLEVQSMEMVMNMKAGKRTYAQRSKLQTCHAVVSES